MPLQYGIHVPSFARPQLLVELGRRAEQYGWDAYLLWDHILGSRETPIPIVDPWVVLGAIAQTTSRIRIGTAVTPVPRRRPWKLAREVITLDRLSDGRVILGVGLGNPPDAEYATFGEPTDSHVLAERLDEGLEVLDGLQRGMTLHFAGRHYLVEGATFAPTPVQAPRVPTWVAATWPHRQPLERAARWDGAIVQKEDAGVLVPMTAEEVGEVAERVRESRGDLEDYDIAVICPGLPENPSGYAKAGATWVLVTGWLDDLPDLIKSGPPPS